MHQFNGMDSLFLYLDAPRTGMHGAFLQIYAPVAGENADQRYARLLRHVERRLPSSPLFRRAMLRSPLDVDHAWWVEGVAVDLQHHVSRSALPKPGTRAQLAQAYSRLYAQAMDLSRPLWEIHVIDGLDAVEGVPEGSFALVVKFHHAGADGVSATEITAALHSSDPSRDDSPPPPHTAAAPARPPSLPAALRRSARLYARFGKALAREFAARAPALARKALDRSKKSLDTAAQGKRGSGKAPRTLLNVPVSDERSYTWLPLGLDAVASIRRQVPGATVNDVLLATVGGALRRFLQDRNGLPARSLIATVPVNVRVESERGQAGNQFTLMFVPLGTQEPDAARRLQGIVEHSARAKQPMRGSGGRKSANWFKIVPAPVLAALGLAVRHAQITARMPPLFNLLVTNVPGPRETLYLDGARLLDISGAPPVVDGAGLLVASSSYDKALRVAVAACRNVMPEPERMRTYLQDAFAELQQAVGAK